MLRVSEEQHRCGLRGIGVPSSPALAPGAPDQVEVEARIAALAPELKAPAAAAAVPAPAPVPATVKTTEVSADLRVRVAETDLLTYPDLSVDRTRGVQCIRRLEPVDSPQLGGEIEYPGRDGQRFVESELGLVRGAQGRVTEADRLHHAFEAYQVGDARRVAEARRCERGLGRLLAKSRSLHAIDQDARVEMDLHPSPIIPPAGSLLGELSVDLLSRKQPIGVAARHSSIVARDAARAAAEPGRGAADAAGVTSTITSAIPSGVSSGGSISILREPGITTVTLCACISFLLVGQDTRSVPTSVSGVTENVGIEDRGRFSRRRHRNHRNRCERGAGAPPDSRRRAWVGAAKGQAGPIAGSRDPRPEHVDSQHIRRRRPAPPGCGAGLRGPGSQGARRRLSEPARTPGSAAAPAW